MSFKIPFEHVYVITLGFPGGREVKNPLANAGNTGDVGDLGGRSSGMGDALEEEIATHTSILAWKLPWTEEPGGLQTGVTKSWIPLSNWAHTCDYFKEGSQALVNFWKYAIFRN